jgi:hypothetical protein
MYEELAMRRVMIHTRTSDPPCDYYEITTLSEPFSRLQPFKVLFRRSATGPGDPPPIKTGKQVQGSLYPKEDEMKINTTSRTILALSAALLLTVSMAWAGDNPQQPMSGSPASVMSPTFGKLEGVIKDAKTGSAIQDVYVSVDGCMNAAMSNESGKIFIKDVPSGTCLVKVAKKGYKPVEISVEVNKDKTAAITVQLKKAPKPVEDEG